MLFGLRTDSGDGRKRLGEGRGGRSLLNDVECLTAAAEEDKGADNFAFESVLEECRHIGWTEAKEEPVKLETMEGREPVLAKEQVHDRVVGEGEVLVWFLGFFRAEFSDTQFFEERASLWLVKEDFIRGDGMIILMGWILEMISLAIKFVGRILEVFRSIGLLIY